MKCPHCGKEIKNAYAKQPYQRRPICACGGNRYEQYGYDKRRSYRCLRCGRWYDEDWQLKIDE